MYNSSLNRGDYDSAVLQLLELYLDVQYPEEPKIDIAIVSACLRVNLKNDGNSAKM